MVNREKIEVISALAEQGYITKTDQIQALSDGKLTMEEADSVADDAIEALTAESADSVVFLHVMQAIWGSFDQWSYEEKEWYSQVMDEVGIESDGKTVYVDPSANPDASIDETEAIAIARHELAKGYEIDESFLDDFKCFVTFQVPERAETGDNQPYWGVEFEAPDDMPKESRPFNSIGLYIHPYTGELLQSVKDILTRLANSPERPTNELYQAIDAYYTRASEMELYSFRKWPLELRAEYSSEIAPKVKSVIQSGDLTELMNGGNVDITVIAQSTYLYGVPQKDVISQDKALALAKASLVETCDLAAELFQKYREINVYYDITATDAPLWKFFFNPKTLPALDMEKGYENPLLDLCYKVEIDAYTGEIAYIEEFPFQTLGHDLAYDLKCY